MDDIHRVAAQLRWKLIQLQSLTVERKTENEGFVSTSGSDGPIARSTPMEAFTEVEAKHKHKSHLEISNESLKQEVSDLRTKLEQKQIALNNKTQELSTAMKSYSNLRDDKEHLQKSLDKMLFQSKSTEYFSLSLRNDMQVVYIGYTT